MGEEKMSVLAGLKPERVFYYFEELCRIPHGSGNTKEVSDYLVQFARDHELSWYQDASNNVVIRRPASKGCELAPTVILQGHCDMVCEKKPGSSHDFTKDGLELHIDGDEIYARDTTLGGDDGIAVAYMLAVLESDDLQLPAIEALITTDEEIGLLGAAALNGNELKGRTLLNMDSEEEGILTVSCAGGMTAMMDLPVRRSEVMGEQMEVTISGLAGGHSGTEIHKNRANSNILAGRFLYELAGKMDYALIELEGGLKDNAIPRTTRMLLAIDGGEKEILKEEALRFTENLCREYNNLPFEDEEARKILIKKIVGSTKENFYITAPFWCDYGYNIELGENFYSNHNMVILDCAKVKFGDNVFVAPNCGFYTAGHPVDYPRRNAGFEYAYPITVGDNVWIGGGVQVMPGVTIGSNVVIGGGSVVVKDIPSDCVAVGNPCKPIRKITDEDMKTCFDKSMNK